MSIETLTPVNNDIRYEIKIYYHKENSYVVYEMKVNDLAYGKQEMLIFRFSQVKKFHDELSKNLKNSTQKIPQFPKTNSFAFWNKTNTSPKKIQDRKRELEFYFTKLLNDPFMRGLSQVKIFLKHAVKQRRRTRSTNFSSHVDILQRANRKSNSLPKARMYNFPRSKNEQLFNQS